MGIWLLGFTLAAWRETPLYETICPVHYVRLFTRIRNSRLDGQKIGEWARCGSEHRHHWCIGNWKIKLYQHHTRVSALYQNLSDLLSQPFVCISTDKSSHTLFRVRS